MEKEKFFMKMEKLKKKNSLKMVLIYLGTIIE